MAGVGPKLVPAGKLGSFDTTQKEELGAPRWDAYGNRFVYVKARSTCGIGHVVGWLRSGTASAGIVTRVKANSVYKLPAGVCLGSISTGGFAWIQAEGYIARVTSKSAIASGAGLCFQSNSVATQVAAGQEHMVFGYALKTDSGSVIPGAIIFCHGVMGRTSQ